MNPFVPPGGDAPDASMDGVEVGVRRWATATAVARPAVLVMGGPALLVLTLTVTRSAAPLDPSVTVPGVAGSLLTLAAGLFVGAGLLEMVRWRLTSEHPAALFGFAMLTYGLLAVPLSRLTVPLAPDAPVLDPVAAALATAGSAPWVLMALHDRRADRHRLGPAVLGGAMSLAAVDVLVLGSAGIALGAQASLGARDEPAIDVGIAIVWVALAAVAVRNARRLGARLAWTSSGVLGALALAALCRALVSSASVWSLPATLLDLAAATLAVAAAARGMQDAILSQRLRQAALESGLRRSEEMLDDVYRWRRGLVHDSRNAMAALKMAMTAIATTGDRLAPTRAEALRDGMLAEIAHLDQLLQPPQRRPVEEFAPSEVPVPAMEPRAGAATAVLHEHPTSTVRGSRRDLRLRLGVLLSLVSARPRRLGGGRREPRTEPAPPKRRGAGRGLGGAGEAGQRVRLRPHAAAGHDSRR